jgi:hypothetical protein
MRLVCFISFSRMRTVILLSIPAAMTYFCKDVRCLWSEVSDDGTSYSDRFAVSLSAEERELLSKASSAGLRDPVQLYASAFYRSPTFALERLLIGAYFRCWQTNSELYRSDWNVGTTVGGLFRVSCF